jgi:hypothetical protein
MLSYIYLYDIHNINVATHTMAQYIYRLRKEYPNWLVNHHFPSENDGFFLFLVVYRSTPSSNPNNMKETTQAMSHGPHPSLPSSAVDARPASKHGSTAQLLHASSAKQRWMVFRTERFWWVRGTSATLNGGWINGHFRNRLIGGTYHIFLGLFVSLNFRKYPQNFYGLKNGIYSISILGEDLPLIEWWSLHGNLVMVSWEWDETWSKGDLRRDFV